MSWYCKEAPAAPGPAKGCCCAKGAGARVKAQGHQTQTPGFSESWIAGSNESSDILESGPRTCDKDRLWIVGSGEDSLEPIRHSVTPKMYISILCFEYSGWLGLRDRCAIMIGGLP